MDWTRADNMDVFFFCATLTGRRGDHTHLYKQERKRPTPVRRRFSRTQPFLTRVVPGMGAGVGDENTGVLWGCPSSPHSIGDPPTAPHVRCCYQVN